MTEEIKVYIINEGETEFEFYTALDTGNTDAIKDEAEKLGTVYSLKGFQNAINAEGLDLNMSFILIA